VQDPVGLAVAKRAQNHRLGLQGTGHGSSSLGPAAATPSSRPTAAILYEVMSNVTVYTTDPCSFCARVKGLLSANGVEFSEINLSKDADGRMELVAMTGMMSFPQVVVGQRLIGGFSEIQRAVEDGRLEELLAA
jgi:glutaredoxin 3